ncbi:MAG: hypothetical protein R3E95_22405 [Thiolinea sp.]
MKKLIARLASLPVFVAGLFLVTATTTLSAAPLTLPADSSKIYQTKGLQPGMVLKMYANPGANVMVNLPHNATWIVRRNAQVIANGVTWEKVSWDNQTGWVDSNKLRYDAQATGIAAARRACMNNPAVADKMCCGYPEAAKGVPFRSVPIYSVRGLQPGQSLMMYVEEGSSAIAIEIPHNATWVTMGGQIAKGGNVSFTKVRWGGKDGWVNSAYLRLDPEKTREGDAKRRRCSGGRPLLPAANPEVVCLPASVIRRLRETGALSEAVLQELSKQPK